MVAALGANTPVDDVYSTDASCKSPCYCVLFHLKEQAQGEAGCESRAENRSIWIWPRGATPSETPAAQSHTVTLQVLANHFERHWPSLVPRHGLVKLSGEGALATLARDSVDTLWRRRADFSTADLQAGFEATLTMLDQSLRLPRRAHRSKAELYEQVLLFIERELENVALDPVLIAQRHGCSLRALQALFAERGSTVAGTIRHQRLERCRAELQGRQADRIGQVAQRWGFTDAAHFSKLFKSAYGQSPRIFRNASIGLGQRAGDMASRR
jgi:AraC-like DNA-binding protein